MPGQDRTGPNGQGPLTGGGYGRCGTNQDQPIRRGFPIGRRFLGFGGRRTFGRGRGRGFGFFADRGFADEALNEENEINYLKDQAARLETALENIHNQIKNLEKPEG